MSIDQALDLAINHLQAGRLAAARETTQRICAAAPDHSDAWRIAGLVEHHLNQEETAVAYMQRAIALRPDSAFAHDNLSVILATYGRFAEAEAEARQASALLPDSGFPHCNLGIALGAQGFVSEAWAEYEQALALGPVSPITQSCAIRCLHYLPGVTLAQLAEIHAQWNRLHAAPLRSQWRPWNVARDPHKRLRLGFVSADFGYHPVGFFLIALLAELDRSQFEVFCYSDRIKYDEVTAKFEGLADVWRTIQQVPDELVAQQIRDDQIDVLFDLAGHTAGNRLLTFARKPAPLQATWMGYVGTTGLEAMDFLFADRYQIPAGAEPHFRETIVRMPDDYICYTPPVDVAEVGPLPARRNGYVTFGSFNNPSKINAQVVAVWSRVLRALPDSRLLLKFQGLEGGKSRQRLVDLFSAQGIDPQRCTLEGWSGRAVLLARYNDVDLSLDTFPYAGGLTTCEALWMGVPVITLPEERFASRHSLSHVSNAGFPELAARDADDFVARALALAGDLPRLEALRAELRPRMAQSPLCDGPRFAAGFQRIVRELWQQWLRGARANQSPIPNP